MINFLKNVFLPKEQKEKKVFTNKDLLKEILECFRQNLEQESLANRMLFPTSFNVLLHPSDYEAREQAFPFVVQEIVNAFYDVIKNRLNEYSNYIPPSQKWNIQFSHCQRINIDEEIILEQGHPLIFAKLYGDTFNNVTSTANTRLSFKPKNSDVYSTKDINRDVFVGIDVIAQGIFSIRFDNDLNQLTTQPNHQGTNVFAELSYIQGGNVVHFQMIDKEISISGKGEDRNESRIMVVNVDNIIIDHVLLKYDSANSNFKIAAYGPLRINELNVKPSSGGDIVWYNLSKRANLLIGNLTPVSFEAKK